MDAQRATVVVHEQRQLVSVTVKIWDDQVAKLANVEQQTGLNRSELIRLALDHTDFSTKAA